MSARVGWEDKRETRVPDELPDTAPAGTVQSTKPGTANSTYAFEPSERTKVTQKFTSAEHLPIEQRKPITDIVGHIRGVGTRKSMPTVALSHHTQPVKISRTSQQNTLIEFVSYLMVLLILSLIFRVSGAVADAVKLAGTKSNAPQVINAPKSKTGSEGLDMGTSVPEYERHH